MNKKILIPLVVVLAVGGFAGYTFAMPKKATKDKIAGTLYVLPSKFTLNMAGGQYATLTVALDLAATQDTGASSGAETSTTEGFGTLPEEPAIRAIITNDVTDKPATALISTAGRAAVRHEILHDIAKQTDVKVTNIYFTDLAVQ
jgi:flagellar basal body-associated protein FliL